MATRKRKRATTKRRRPAAKRRTTRRRSRARRNPSIRTTLRRVTGGITDAALVVGGQGVVNYGTSAALDAINKSRATGGKPALELWPSVAVEGAVAVGVGIVSSMLLPTTYAKLVTAGALALPLRHAAAVANLPGLGASPLDQLAPPATTNGTAGAFGAPPQFRVMRVNVPHGRNLSAYVGRRGLSSYANNGGVGMLPVPIRTGPTQHLGSYYDSYYE